MRQAVNVRRLAAGLLVVGALCGVHPRSAEAISITVAGNAPWGVATGIFASPGQQFVISATGIVDLASTDARDDRRHRCIRRRRVRDQRIERKA